jgi:hypothetical protein
MLLLKIVALALMVIGLLVVLHVAIEMLFEDES